MANDSVLDTQNEKNEALDMKYQEEHMTDEDIDVEDCRLAVLNAEKEVKDAIEWHQKMLLNYANAIIIRDKVKKV